jgi:hypothetical protein
VATNGSFSRALLRHDRRGRCFINGRTATTKQVLTLTSAKVLPDEDLKPGIPVHLHLRTIGTSMRPVELIYLHTPCRYSQRLHCAGGVVTTNFLSSRCQSVIECGTKLSSTRPGPQLCARDKLFRIWQRGASSAGGGTVAGVGPNAHMQASHLATMYCNGKASIRSDN